MQKRQYEGEASQWTLHNPNPVVGSYHEHNAWSDYDTFLFRNFETQGKVALEYGCGPGRNLIRFKNRFSRIDGVDIAENNLIKAKENLLSFGPTDSKLILCDGSSIPTEDESYDVVFSVICLQHIASYSIRYSIMKEVYRVLKPSGYFCFQMGVGGKEGYPYCEYHDDAFHAGSTNGGFDVTVRNAEQLEEDLVGKLGFVNFTYELRPTGPGDRHKNWIWIQAQKP